MTTHRTDFAAVVLISGGGSNLQAIIDAIAARALEMRVAAVISDNPHAHGLVRAENAGIETRTLQKSDYPHREQFDEALAVTLDTYDPDIIILAGFMRILSAGFVERYAGKILNIHPALLPLHPGLNTHQRVLDAGDTWHGSTVHFVTRELDAGPRILQGRLTVNANESANELAARVQMIEHQIYPQAASWVGSGRVEYRDGQTWIDGRLSAEPVIKTFQA